MSGARGREPRGARRGRGPIANAGRRRQFLLGVFGLLSLLLAHTEAPWLVALFVAFAQDNLMSRRVGEMKSYLFPIYSALKLLLVVSFSFSSVILRAPKWRAFMAGVMGYAAIPQPAVNV